MNHFISNIVIKNFKSIKALELQDCKRINVFIGEPNVGKSNILEALTLASYPNTNANSENIQMIRFERHTELHYAGNLDNQIDIRIIGEDKQSANVSKDVKGELYFSYNGGDSFRMYADRLPEKRNDYPFCIAKYHFDNRVLQNYDGNILLVPDGKNLPSVLNRYKGLMKEVQSLFIKNNQQLIIDKSSNSLKVMSKSQSEDYS